jgi:hypothetical protein
MKVATPSGQGRAQGHLDEVPFDDSAPRDEHPESLVLDIGDDIGALVLYAATECLGLEIDVTPAGTPRSHHLHTMIRRRRAPNRELIAGVYPALQAGSYTVWGLDGEPIADITITGGEITEYHAGTCQPPQWPERRITIRHRNHQPCRPRINPQSQTPEAAPIPRLRAGRRNARPVNGGAAGRTGMLAARPAHQSHPDLRARPRRRARTGRPLALTEGAFRHPTSCHASKEH